MRWMILWLLTTLVATCGQKGPLYLPEDSPERNGSPEAGSWSASKASSIYSARVKP